MLFPRACFASGSRPVDMAGKMFPTVPRESLLVAFTAAAGGGDGASATVADLSVACAFLEAGTLPTPAESRGRTPEGGRLKTPPAGVEGMRSMNIGRVSSIGGGGLGGVTRISETTSTSAAGGGVPRPPQSHTSGRSDAS